MLPRSDRLAGRRFNFSQATAVSGRSSRSIEGGHILLEAAAADRDGITAETDFECEMELAEHRFNWITSLVDEMTGHVVPGTTWSDRIDRVLTNRLLGVPIFLAVMWIVLRFTADVTAPYVDWIDATISGPIARWVESLLSVVSLGGGWIESLLVDGVLAGVGGVLELRAGAFWPVPDAGAARGLRLHVAGRRSHGPGDAGRRHPRARRSCR